MEAQLNNHEVEFGDTADVIGYRRSGINRFLIRLEQMKVFVHKPCVCEEALEKIFKLSENQICTTKHCEERAITNLVTIYIYIYRPLRKFCNTVIRCTLQSIQYTFPFVFLPTGIPRPP